TAFTGAVITPFYDSLLVKVTAHGLRFVDAARRMERSLQEFRVRGVKTNIPFLINLVTHADFLPGRFTTRFLDETPELFRLPQRQDRATRLLTYTAETIVNGYPGLRSDQLPPCRGPLPPTTSRQLVATKGPPPGTRDKFHELGAEKFAKWVLEQNALLVTDT